MLVLSSLKHNNFIPHNCIKKIMDTAMRIMAQLLMIMLCLSSTPAVNAEESSICMKAAIFFEKKYDIPDKLLQSIIIVESRRGKNPAPWPWSANIQSKPYYFDDYHSFEKFVNNTVNAGTTNIDVGCAQINWHYHNMHFDNISALIDPITNIAYSAYFLTTLYKQYNDWNKAVSSYHSKNKTHGSIYLHKVKLTQKEIL